MKICLRCKKLNNIDNFYKNKNKKDGRDPYCKLCCKKYADLHRERRSNTQKKFRLNNLNVGLFKNAELRAKKKNIEFNIECSDIVVPDICPVLGIKIEVGEKVICDNSPTLDRIDISKGYIKGNIIVISNRANRLKNDATLNEIELIYNYYIKGSK